MLLSFRKRMLDMRPSNEFLVPSILATLGAFAMACLSSTYVYLIEQAVCRKHFMVNDPARINGAGLVDEESCKIPDIQAQVASINGIYMFLAFLPGKELPRGFTKIQNADPNCSTPLYWSLWTACQSFGKEDSYLHEYLRVCD
jgi:hypothetical protein